MHEREGATSRFRVSERQRRALRRIRAALITVFAVIGLLHAILLSTPVLRLWTRWLTGSWDQPGGDVLVVLAGDDPVTDGGPIGYSSYWRALYATRAYSERRFSTIIVSGGDGSARSIADYMTSQGVPPTVIRIEDRSTSTHENAVYTAAILQNHQGSVALLSSDFHMRRARAAFSKAGVVTRSWPVPDAGKRLSRWQNYWWVFLDLLTETGKLCWYTAKGFI